MSGAFRGGGGEGETGRRYVQLQNLYGKVELFGAVILEDGHPGFAGAGVKGEDWWAHGNRI